MNIVAVVTSRSCAEHLAFLMENSIKTPKNHCTIFCTISTTKPFFDHGFSLIYQIDNFQTIEALATAILSLAPSYLLTDGKNPLILDLFNSLNAMDQKIQKIVYLSRDEAILPEIDSMADKVLCATKSILLSQKRLSIGYFPTHRIEELNELRSNDYMKKVRIENVCKTLKENISFRKIFVYLCGSTPEYLSQGLPLFLSLLNQKGATPSPFFKGTLILMQSHPETNDLDVINQFRKKNPLILLRPSPLKKEEALSIATQVGGYEGEDLLVAHLSGISTLQISTKPGYAATKGWISCIKTIDDLKSFYPMTGPLLLKSRLEHLIDPDFLSNFTNVFSS